MFLIIESTIWRYYRFTYERQSLDSESPTSKDRRPETRPIAVDGNENKSVTEILFETTIVVRRPVARSFH